MDYFDQNLYDLAAVVAARVADSLRDNPPVVPEYLNAKQAASFTGFTPKALERMRQRGEGAAYTKLGTRIRYRIDDLREWMEAGR